jgi:hypothetical protein
MVVVVVVNMMGNEWMVVTLVLMGRNGGGDPRNRVLEWLRAMDPTRSSNQSYYLQNLQVP